MRATNYKIRGTVYRLVGTVVVIEHADGRVEMYRKCETINEAIAKLEAAVIRAASEAVFCAANDAAFL